MSGKDLALYQTLSFCPVKCVRNQHFSLLVKLGDNFAVVARETLKPWWVLSSGTTTLVNGQ